MKSGNLDSQIQQPHQAFIKPVKDSTKKISDRQMYQMIKFKDKTIHPSKYFDYVVIGLIM